ncbi:uncharacterized protein SCODWIG_00241 [Saccharomycodes ludwigii]|uniref:U6 snRNA phosphodiesterase 1 n=1 Tax=Saccharomycodes ludwigii TaxID=36035 RepID=A0A376B2X3_9ASCO|nr:hypothetical protein SCDLUD_001770 [Saccharomycodes ludwigii]KAH3901982.1 hypothetical protein SCDLUD_001770 [Saccharomycodes ludwigii]SSD58480.1 uncharacterized protein SCODWIG_00241 [Saccharomycodes ludwigii]
MNLIKTNYSQEEEEEEYNNRTSTKTKIEPDKVAKPGEPIISTKIQDKYYITPNIDKYLSKNNIMLGNYSSFFFINLRLNLKQRNVINNLLTDLHKTFKNENNPYSKNIKSLAYSDLGAPLPLHLSLTHNIIFENQKYMDDFFSYFKTKYTNNTNCNGFKLQFKNKLIYLPNEDNTKIFICLAVTDEICIKYLKPLQNDISDILSGYTSYINKSFAENTIPHVSIGSIIKTTNEPFNGTGTDIKFPCYELDKNITEQLEINCHEIKATRLRSNITFPLPY